MGGKGVLIDLPAGGRAHHWRGAIRTSVSVVTSSSSSSEDDGSEVSLPLGRGRARGKATDDQPFRRPVWAAQVNAARQEEAKEDLNDDEWVPIDPQKKDQRVSFYKRNK